MTNLYSDRNWKFSTIEGAELSRLLRGLQTSFREKLEWLEEAGTGTSTLQLRVPREEAASGKISNAGMFFSRR
ncbi:MAG TPA: hypothetical protein VEH04_12760 [Verrucomicrobiae bacterium]|nr:hypothetical protein [Verrucomicrobiae bacterium]